MEFIPPYLRKIYIEFIPPYLRKIYMEFIPPLLLIDYLCDMIEASKMPQSLKNIISKVKYDFTVCHSIW